MDWQPLLQPWKTYITTKLKTQKARPDLIAKLKLFNNNQQHIQPHVTKQAEFIINKIIHAFATSIVTIYDTKIFDVLLSLFPEIEPELKKYIQDFIAQSPWLYVIQDGFIKTLALIKQYILYSHTDNSEGAQPNILLTPSINETIYNILNCWAISCFTVIFSKSLFSLATIELNLPYLFFIAGSYSVVDFIIDENTEHPQVIRDVLRQFEAGLLDNQTGITGTSLKESTLRAIKHLINTYKHGSTPNPSKLQMIIYSMSTEKECFKNQRTPGLSDEKIIELGIHKGLSTGHLILTSLNETSYKSCITHQHIGLFNHYCVLIQLLDDLSDFTKDIADGINTFGTLFKTNYVDYAWFVIECVLDFLEEIRIVGIFNTHIQRGFNLLFINYWCYCCNKNMALLDDELLRVIKDNYLFDMNYVIQMRAEKHKKKYELYKLLMNEM